MSEHSETDKRLQLAVQTRNFEIELFWKRSLFFWGFIASAFAGYAALHQTSPTIAVAIACFGTVCSFSWALVTRGSKYWQENWEAKVDECEKDVIGKFFAVETPLQTHKGPWLQARKYSVSKISIALSDYVFILWLCILFAHASKLYIGGTAIEFLLDWGPLGFILLSIAFLFLLFIVARTSKRLDTE